MSQSDYIRGNRPGIRIAKGQYIAVNKRTLRSLGCPKYIIFWHSPKENTLFIACADERSDLSFPVADTYYRTRTGYQLQNTEFLNAVKNVAKWGDDVTCAVDGEYLDALGMVAFHLKNTRVMEDNSHE